MPVPCVRGNVAGLSIFQATADQRFLLGAPAFMRTHSPARFWLERAGARTEWSEGELLNALLDGSEASQGNRVFVLFGAAGAGKSEVMRWLLLRFGEMAPDRQRFSLRIPRTDLDPVRIVHRILETFDPVGIGEASIQRWDALRRKPVALANQLVWQALDGMYECDEQILPLSYRLRPIVESNLCAGLAAIDQPGSAQAPLHLLTREQLAHVLSDTALELDPVYEHLRSRLQQAFEQAVFGDIRVIDVMREISRSVKQRFGVRPLLLVDDLVQSMNIYASDLLDYLITLEEGEWDVVLGLTPAAFEWDQRGRELLLRIRELDTVDDRVTKLALSDASGDTSSFLTEESAGDYLGPYLDMYKEAAGYTCGATCPHHEQCTGLQWGMRDDARLTPLNPAFVSRLWRHLPRGKGRARHLLLAVREALETMATGGVASLEVLPRMVERDVYVSHPDPRVRALLECYAPGTEAGAAPAALGEAWALDGNILSQTSVQSLRPEQAVLAGVKGRSQVENQGADSTLAAVRDWLEGGSPNPELLRPLRSGVARFLREVIDPGLLAGYSHAQPNGAFRWSAVQDGVNLPLPIEGLDNYEGIKVDRGLGSAALVFAAYSEANTSATRASLIPKLLANDCALQLLYRAEEQRVHWQQQATSALSCALDELAFHLFRVALSFGADMDAPLPFMHEACPPAHPMPWPADLARTLKLFWDDCFRLRDHLYDGHRIARFQRRWPQVADSLEVLVNMPLKSLKDAYRLCDRPLGEVLLLVQTHLRAVQAWLLAEVSQWGERKTLMDLVSRLSDGRRRKALVRREQALTQAAAALLPSVTLSPLPLVESKDAEGLLSIADQGYDPADMPRAYRMNATWFDECGQSGLLGVQRWSSELNALYRQVAAFHSRVGGSLAQQGNVPSTASGLLEGAVSLMTDIRRLVHDASTVKLVHQTLTSPDGQHYQNLSRLLVLLLPEGFEVAKRYSAERQRARATLTYWATAVTWVSNHRIGEPAPAAQLPGSKDVASVQDAVREACRWWEAYFKQLPILIGSGSCASLREAHMFLAQVRQLILPAADLLDAWSHFVNYARRRGTEDLPLLSGLDSTPCSPEVHAWVDALVGDRGTVSLQDLTPDMLAVLQAQIPHWLQVIHLQVVR